MVALVGPNGAGKTMPGSHLVSLPGRGLRRATLEDVADNQGDGSWAVSAEVEGHWACDARHRHRGAARRRRSGPALPHRPRERGFGGRLRRSSAHGLADTRDGRPLFMGAASERRRFFDRLVLAIDSEHSSRVSARTVPCARATASWRCAISTTIGATRSSADRRACGRGRGDARPDALKLAAMLRARGQASAFPSAEIALDGWMENALSRAGHRRRGPLPEDPARGPRARCRAGRTFDGPHLTDLQVIYAPKNMPARMRPPASRRRC